MLPSFPVMVCLQLQLQRWPTWCCSLHISISYSVCVCVCPLTENENPMAEWLSAVGLHSDVQHGGISSNDADSVFLLRLPEHSKQLIGYDPIQRRYDHHGDHKRQECVDLLGGGAEHWRSGKHIGSCVSGSQHGGLAHHNDLVQVSHLAMLFSLVGLFVALLGYKALIGNTEILCKREIKS